MSRTANSGAVFPGMQVFFARFYAILWELRHAIFIGGMGKREVFTLRRFDRRDTHRRRRCQLFVLAQTYLNRCKHGAKPCCGSFCAELARKWVSTWQCREGHDI